MSFSTDICMIINWLENLLTLGLLSLLCKNCMLLILPPFFKLIWEWFSQQIFVREWIHWRTSCFLVCSLQFTKIVLSFFLLHVSGIEPITKVTSFQWTIWSNSCHLVSHPSSLSQSSVLVRFFFSSVFIWFFWLFFQRYLFSNQLSGPLPSSWSALINLQYLCVLFACRLSHILVFNALRFQIFGRQSIDWRTSWRLGWSLISNPPVWFLSIIFSFYWGVQQRYLSNNQLTGELPASWSALVNLEALYVLFSPFFCCQHVILLISLQVSGQKSIKWRITGKLERSHQSEKFVRLPNYVHD